MKKERKYMIKSKEDFIFFLQEDRKHILEPYNISFDGKVKPKLIPRSEIEYIYKFQYILRKLEYRLNCKNSGLVSKIFTRILEYRFFKLQIKTGMFIHPNCFGPGLAIKHIGPMVISGGVLIGKNCRIHPCVNIGVSGSEGKVGQLGDNLYLGNGCKIIGEVYLQDNVVIGAGAVVTKSFEESNIVLAGVPAKIVSHKGSTEFPLF